MLSWDWIRFCILTPRHTDHLSNNNWWRREHWQYIFKIFCRSQNLFKNIFSVAGSTHGYTFLQSHRLISIPLTTCEAENVNTLLSSGMKKKQIHEEKSYNFCLMVFKNGTKCIKIVQKKTWKIALKSVKMDDWKIWKKRLGVPSLGTLCPKMSFIGQKLRPVAREQTDTQTHRESKT